MAHTTNKSRARSTRSFRSSFARLQFWYAAPELRRTTQFGGELATQLYFGAGVTNAVRNKTRDDEKLKEAIQPLLLPRQFLFLCEITALQKYYFQHFSLKISQIRFLKRKMDSVVKPTDVYEQPKDKYSIEATLKGSYRQGSVLNHRVSKHS